VAVERFEVDAAQAGMRLDKLLVALLPGVGRRKASRLFDDGLVRVGGRRATKGTVARLGEIITVTLPDDADHGAIPEPDAALVVTLETDRIVVVEKPAGQPTAPIRAGETGTLANALVGHYPEMAAVGHAAREPGLVHRLDTGTSGLVLAARDAAAFAALSAGLKAGGLVKKYLLICAGEGLASSGTIEIPLAHHPKDKKRMYACAHPRDVARYAPREASTSFAVVRVVGPWALVEATAAAALRHQIRAHMAAIGHPLANDALYGGAAVPGLDRHALHANRIVWKGDPVVPAFEAASELPDDLARVFAAQPA
jgi:23S rRNA pseudouridine1911/1915/1917 synthase